MNSIPLNRIGAPLTAISPQPPPPPADCPIGMPSDSSRPSWLAPHGGTIQKLQTTSQRIEISCPA
jgi:hypothetical protein